jgi:RHS repeat-associated protein
MRSVNRKGTDNMFSHKLTAFGAALGAILLGAVLQGIPSAASAHDFGGTTNGGPPNPPKPPRPCCGVEKPCKCPPKPTSGKPIDFWTGGETLTNLDLRVPGQFPIVLTRTYDSQSDFDSALGFGWAFSHDRALFEYPDGSIILRLSSGVRERYVASGGGYQSAGGSVLGTLIQKPDGSFQLSYVDGTRDLFDSLGRLTAEVDRTGNRHEYTYDARGKLPLTGTSSVAVDPNTPLVVAYIYRVARIDERAADGALSGRHVLFSYNESTGRMTSVTANDGRSVSYQHDSTAGTTRGNLIQVNGLDGVVKTYAYADPNDQHNLTSITEAAGRTPLVNTYDTQDRVIRQDEGTRRIEFNYQTPLVRTIVTRTIRDQNGLNPYTSVDTYDFDATGRTTKQTDALGHETRYIYNAAKDLSRKEIWQKAGATLALLQATDYTYDTSGRKLTESVTLDSGEVVTKSWTYDHDWVASEQTVSSAAPSKLFRTEFTFNYDGEGRPRSIQSQKRRKDDGSFVTTSFTYDSRNRLLSKTLPDGVEIVHEYTGDFVSKTYIEVGGSEIPQLAAEFEHDAEGNLIKRWDARGNLTQFAYDDQGRRISETNPLGEQTLFTYVDELMTQTEVGRTTADGEGQVTKYLFDARGRVTGVQRKDGAGVFQTFATYEFDSEDQRLAMIDAVGRRTAFAYDALGRLISTTDSLNKTTQYAYDAVGNRTSVTDALGRQTVDEYDDLNRRTAMVQLGLSPNPRTEFSFDAVGNMTALRDAENHTVSYEFDALRRNTKVTQAYGAFVEYGYDDRDQIVQKITARGQKITFGYEPWGRLKEEKQYPTTSSSTPDRTITYAYDLDGNQTSVTDDGVQSGAMLTSTYDALNRRLDETIKYLPGGDRVLERRYDRFGNRRELTLQDGSAITSTETFNRLNQLASANLAGNTLTFSYFANDELQQISFPAGVTRGYTWHANGLVDAITVSGPSGQIDQFDYTYDDVRNVDTMTDADGVHDFNYDGLKRLTSASRPSGVGLPTESYVHDRVGNRKDPANASLYAYDVGNRITASPGRTYVFDADGNLATRSDGATFTHDMRNRLAAFAKGSVSATYLYDAEGRRIRKTVGSTTTWFLWDGSKLLAEFSSAGVRQKRYDYVGPDVTPIQMQDSNGTYVLHNDHLDTPRLLTGASAQTVWKARYESSGKALVESDPDGNSVPVTMNLRFPGQYEDEESGLHYNLMRDYDPALGSYIQSDPIGVKGGVNLYSYVDRNPINRTDPTGLKWCSGSFVRHFYTGGGRAVSLSGIGLLGDFRNHSSVAGPVAQWKSQLESQGHSTGRGLVAGCQCSGEVKTSKFNGSTTINYNVTGDEPFTNCLWSLGAGRVDGQADCFVYADCLTKKYSWHCSLEYRGRDRFTQPLDITRWGVHIQGEVGGTPYDINIAWDEFIAGGN